MYERIAIILELLELLGSVCTAVMAQRWLVGWWRTGEHTMIQGTSAADRRRNHRVWGSAKSHDV